MVVAVVIFIIFLNKNTTYYKYEYILIIFILIGICLEEEFRAWKKGDASKWLQSLENVLGEDRYWK